MFPKLNSWVCWACEGHEEVGNVMQFACMHAGYAINGWLVVGGVAGWLFKSQKLSVGSLKMKRAIVLCYNTLVYLS